MKQLILLFSLFTFTICLSQNEIINRKPFKLDIAVDTENNYVMNVEATPYFVKDKILQIYPTEEVNIETEIKGDTIHTMKIVSEIMHPEKTIIIKFNQNNEDRKNIITMLSVKNPFDKKLTYSAIIFTPNSNSWKQTSIIPIQPKLMNFETWPHSIISIVLNEWRLE